VHTGISGSMADASPGKVDPSSLRALNTRLEPLRELPRFDFPFESLLDGSQPEKPELPRKPSKRLLERVGKEQLERYDRSWERAIVAQAELEHWSFWQAESALPLRDVSAWNQALADRLFPRGIVLYCEKAPDSPEKAGLWGGRWSVVLDPGIGSPAELVSDTRWTPLG